VLSHSHITYMFSNHLYFPLCKRTPTTGIEPATLLRATVFRTV